MTPRCSSTRRRLGVLLAAMLGAGGLLHCSGGTPDPKTLRTLPNGDGVNDGSVSSTSKSDAGDPAAQAVTKQVDRVKAAEDELKEREARLRAIDQQLDAAPQDASLLAERADASAQVAAASANVDVETHLQHLAAGAKAETPDPKKQAEIEFESGGRLRYGLSVSLLQLAVSRSESEPGRLRNYEPKLEVLPSEIGFQFTHQPVGPPWRFTKKDGGTFQLMSWGGMLLTKIDKRELAQGAIRLGLTLNFFENVVGLGAGFDLYRGIPIRGADGIAGSATAYTGLLSWAFSPEGEVTPENVFVVLTFGLDPIVRALSGELK